MGKYEGPERRHNTIQAEQIRGMAIRLMREGVHIDTLETRKDDPEGLVEGVRAYSRSLVEGGPEGQLCVPETGIEEITEDTPWLLPGSDPEEKRRFINTFNRAKGNLIRAVMQILARAGIGNAVSHEQVSAEARRMLPNMKSLQVAGNIPYCSLTPSYLKKAGYDIEQGGYGLTLITRDKR